MFLTFTLINSFKKGSTFNLSLLVTQNFTAKKTKKANYPMNLESNHDIFLTSAKIFSNPFGNDTGNPSEWPSSSGLKLLKSCRF